MPNPPQPLDEAVLRQLQPIAALSPERVRELAPLCFVEIVPAGTVLFSEGEYGEQAIYLLGGEVELRSAAGTRRVGAGDPTAHHALSDRQPREATAETASDCRLLRLDEDLLDIFLTWDQLLAAQARRRATRREDGPERAMYAMLHSPAFHHLPPANLERLAERLERVAVQAGEVIVRRGDEGDFYYLIDRGTAEVARDTPEGRLLRVELGDGAAFGEEALASGAPRNATVTMKTDSVLWRLAKRDFNELLRAPLLNWVMPRPAAVRVNDGSARWLDVRHEAEYVHTHLPGALWLPLHDLRARVADLDSGPEYICYCKTGRRSSAAAFLLSQRGFRAQVLRGGLQALPSGDDE
jgi:CRP-like cAMP-binding protein/rhodanese-related sulfurtransferase